MILVVLCTFGKVRALSECNARKKHFSVSHMLELHHDHSDVLNNRVSWKLFEEKYLQDKPPRKDDRKA
jgi:hypothetical protein